MMIVTTVMVIVGPPRLLSESYQRRRVLRAGVNLRLVCPVESPPPPPLVKWTKDREAVHLGWERYRVHAGVLRIRNVNVDDSGVFVCHATNGFGTIDVKFLVYVYGTCCYTSFDSIAVFTTNMHEWWYVLTVGIFDTSTRSQVASWRCR